MSLETAKDETTADAGRSTRAPPDPPAGTEAGEQAGNQSSALPVDADAPDDGEGEEDKPQRDVETATDATAESEKNDESPVKAGSGSGSIVVSSSKKTRPPYKYDPNKITLRFLFANRDGLAVTVECNPSDTVGEVKASLMSVWPKDMPSCEEGENLRLICMGKGFLTPDTRTLEDCQIPMFKTHPTPINVSIKPGVSKSKHHDVLEKHKKASEAVRMATSTGQGTAQGCGCVIS